MTAQQRARHIVPRTARMKDIGFPRGEWLERKIAKGMDHMGFPMPCSKPYIEEFWRWFLTKAHLQGRLQGMKDRDKVRHYFTMLLYYTRYRRESKCERRLVAVTTEMMASCEKMKAFALSRNPY